MRSPARGALAALLFFLGSLPATLRAQQPQPPPTSGWYGQPPPPPPPPHLQQPQPQPYPPYPPPPPQAQWQQPAPPPPTMPVASERSRSLNQVGVGLRLDLGLSLLTSPPGLALETPNGVQMSQFGDRPVKAADTTYLFSTTVSFYLKTGTPLMIPILGFELGIPVATGYPGTVDIGTPGSPLVWLKTEESTYYTGIDFFGLGIEHWIDPIGFGFDVRPGFRYLRMAGALTQNLLTVDAYANTYTFSLHGDAEVCVRFGQSIGAACLYGGPHIYEFGTWMNGFVAGLRFGALVSKKDGG